MIYLKRIHDFREGHNLTQAHMAQLLGVAQNTYSQYERGERPLPLDYFIYLCKYFKVSADYLLGFTDENRSPFKSPSGRKF